MARGVAGAGGTRRHSSVAWRAVGEYPCLGHPRPPFQPRLSQRLCNRFRGTYPIEPDLPPLAAPPQRLFRGMKIGSGGQTWVTAVGSVYRPSLERVATGR